MVLELRVDADVVDDDGMARVAYFCAQVVATSRPSPTLRAKSSLSSRAQVVQESPVTRAMHTKRMPVSAATASRMVGIDEIDWMDAMSPACSVIATFRYLVLRKYASILTCQKRRTTG